MLENLQDLVRQYAGDAILNNDAIPGNKKEEAVADASSAIISGLKTAVANGNLDGVTNFFKGGAEGALTSPVTKDIEAGYTNNLVQKFGLDKGVASKIAATLIPLVLQKFVHKTNDPGEKGFDLQSILNGLTGGGIGDMLNKYGGATDKNDDEGFLGKVKGMFS